MKKEIKNAIVFGINCMFDLDAAAAGKAIQKVMNGVIDPQTRKIHMRNTSPEVCFKITGDQLSSSVKHFEAKYLN